MSTTQADTLERVVGLGAVAAALIHFRGSVWPDLARSNVTSATMLGAAVAVFICVLGLGYLTGTLTPLRDGINLTDIALVIVWGGYTALAVFLWVSGEDSWGVVAHSAVGIAGSIGMAVAFLRSRT